MSVLSGEYALFVLLSVATFWMVPPRWRAPHLAISSLLFTVFLGPVAVAFVVVATVAAWTAGIAVEDEWPRGRQLAVGSILVSLTVFFAGKLIGALTFDENVLDSTVLPLGFAFYTFQTIAYSVEVLRGRIGAERDVIRFGAYVAFYPHLTAGPVLAPRRVLPQFGDRLSGDLKPQIPEGIDLVILGVFKKVVLADYAIQLAISTNLEEPAQRIAFYLMLPLAAYFDISGFLNIARGIGKFYGLNLPRSFAQPITHGRNVTDYWRRWQIPLLSWFREYVYRPVLERVPGRFGPTVAIFATFMAAGLWHAIDAVWLLWGVLTAVAIILDRRLQAWLVARDLSRHGRTFWRTFRRAALLVYVFGTQWLTSQIIDLESVGGSAAQRLGTSTADVLGTLLVLTIALVLLDDYEHRRLTGELKVEPTATRGVLWGLAIVGITIYWNASGFIPFTYAGF
ncbi:MAG: MBOAT family O-acyltransferase [Actinomycetota bacterium]